MALATQKTDKIQGNSGSSSEGKFTYKDGGVIYQPSPYALGRLYNYDGDTTTVISRTYFTFNMTNKLHAGSTINQVNVVYNTSYAVYTFKITQVANVTSNDSTNYNAIGNGNTMNSGIPYGTNSGTSPLVSPNIKNIMPHTGTFYLGALSENETGNDTHSAVASLTLYVIETYTAQSITLTAENNLHGQHAGQIGVGVNGGATSHSSPYGFTATEQQTVNLQAYDNQMFGNYSSVYNDIEAPNNRSQWTKTIPGHNEAFYANPQSTTYSANINDNNGLFVDYLKYNFAVSRNDETEFDGTSSAGVVTHIVESNSGTVPAPSTKTVGSNNYNFAGWENGGNGVFSPTDNSLYPNPAMYKVTHKSNNASAFVNNSQRKLVRTRDGWLHQVYESMGHVWLEQSTDGGSTWFIGNGGTYLDNGAGKCPSIDWHYNVSAPTNTNYYAVVVAYQQQSGNTYTIEYAVFKYANGSYVRQSSSGPLYTEPSGGDQYATTNANPNIAWGEYYYFALAFERKSTVGSMQPGIYWCYGIMYETTLYSYSPLILINGTTSGSTNATISLNKLSSDYTNFWIVYQQGSSSIYYVQLFCTQSGSGWIPSQPRSPGLMSAASGVKNYQPSIVQMPDSYDLRACWIRDWYGVGSMTPYYVNVVYWDIYSPSVYNCTGNMVNSVSLNIRDSSSNTYYAFAQNTNNSTWQNFGSNGSSTISLNTTGRNIQLSNGPSSAAMYASSYYPVSLPYYFQTSNSFGQLQKTESGQMNIGRGAVLVKGDAQFCYSLKSLTVDNTSIKFRDIPVNASVSSKPQLTEESMYFPSLDSLNEVLLSEPFSISGSPSVTITEQAGFADTSKAITALGSNGYIACKLELIDNTANKTIAKIKDWKITASSPGSYGLSTSSLDVHKLGAMTVRVRMTISTNVDNLQGALMNEYGTIDKNALAKSAMNQIIVLQSPEIVTTYALSQNYPNPFNPTTTIAYQIPNDGKVTIKIFDVTGREVTTLVDEFKSSGQYSVKFDASRLSSGIYFYSIRSGDYNAVKKMSLIK